MRAPIANPNADPNPDDIYPSPGPHPDAQTSDTPGTVFEHTVSSVFEQRLLEGTGPS